MEFPAEHAPSPETDENQPSDQALDQAPDQASDPASDAHDRVEKASPGRRSRLRRWGRRTAIGCAALLVLTTTASFVFNGFTATRAAPPPGLSYVEADGIRTRYQQWGGTGTPIVLVHGAFESADTWSRLAPLLARDHRVYALDLTGYGYSERKGPYTVGHQADQLLGFLDAMRLGAAGDRPVLVGHSSGAAVIAQAALRSPGRIAGLMLLDGDALDTGAGPPTAFRYILINPFKTSILRIGLSFDALIRRFYDAQCGPRCPALDHAGVDVWRRPFQVSGAEAALWSMLDEGVPGLPADQVAALRSVNLPKSVVFGGGDDVFSPQTPAQTADRIGAPPPTIIPGAKHLTMISNPDEVAAAIRALTSRAPA